MARQLALSPLSTEVNMTGWRKRQIGEHMKTYEDDEFERIEREMKWRQIPDELPKAIPFITEEELEQLLKEET
jgi:hypothetical protein